MQAINSEIALRETILQLEKKQAVESEMLKEHLLVACNSVKPINLLISTFREAAASRELKVNMVNTFVGLTAGYLSKMLVQGATKSPFKKLLGNAFMLGVTNAVAKNPEMVQALGRGILRIIRGNWGVRGNHL